MKQFLKVAWIIYLVYYLYISFIGIRGLLLNSQSLSLADWRSIIESILLILAIFSLAFNVKVLPKLIWQNLLYLFIAVWLLDFAFALSFFSHFPTLDPWFVQSGYSNMSYLLSQDIYAVVVSLPALWAIFRLGYKGS